MFQSAEILKQRGMQLFNQARSFVRFTDDGADLDGEVNRPIEAFEELINNINEMPHAFVLAC